MNIEAIIDRVDEVRHLIDDLQDELREVHEEMIVLQSMLEIEEE